jgi:antitoxin VapB
MSTERHVSIFRNGSNQAIRIPREFELEGTEAVIRREGDRLIIEPLPKPNRLLVLLESWEPLDVDFPEPDDPAVAHEDIFE